MGKQAGVNIKSTLKNGALEDLLKFCCGHGPKMCQCGSVLIECCTNNVWLPQELHFFMAPVVELDGGDVMVGKDSSVLAVEIVRCRILHITFKTFMNNKQFESVGFKFDLHNNPQV